MLFQISSPPSAERLLVQLPHLSSLQLCGPFLAPAVVLHRTADLPFIQHNLATSLKFYCKIGKKGEKERKAPIILSFFDTYLYLTVKVKKT